jgi:hypothetical protein
MCASLGLERVGGAEGEGKSFVVLSKVIIDLAGEEGGQITGLIGHIISLIHGLAEGNGEQGNGQEGEEREAT